MQATHPADPNPNWTGTASPADGQGSPVGPRSSPTKSRKRPAQLETPAKSAQPKTISLNCNSSKRSRKSSPNKSSQVKPACSLGPPPTPFPTQPTPEQDTIPKPEPSPSHARTSSIQHALDLILHPSVRAAAIASEARQMAADYDAVRAVLDSTVEEVGLQKQVIEQMVDAEQEAAQGLRDQVDALEGQLASAVGKLKDAEDEGRARVARLEGELAKARGEVQVVQAEKKEMADDVRRVLASWVTR